MNRDIHFAGENVEEIVTGILLLIFCSYQNHVSRRDVHVSQNRLFTPILEIWKNGGRKFNVIYNTEIAMRALIWACSFR